MTDVIPMVMILMSCPPPAIGISAQKRLHINARHIYKHMWLNIFDYVLIAMLAAH